MQFNNYELNMKQMSGSIRTQIKEWSLTFIDGITRKKQ